MGCQRGLISKHENIALFLIVVVSLTSNILPNVTRMVLMQRETVKSLALMFLCITLTCAEIISISYKALMHKKMLLNI